MVPPYFLKNFAPGYCAFRASWRQVSPQNQCSMPFVSRSQHPPKSCCLPHRSHVMVPLLFRYQRLAECIFYVAALVAIVETTISGRPVCMATFDALLDTMVSTWGIGQCARVGGAEGW